MYRMLALLSFGAIAASCVLTLHYS